MRSKSPSGALHTSHSSGSLHGYAHVAVVSRLAVYMFAMHTPKPLCTNFEVSRLDPLAELLDNTSVHPAGGTADG